MMVEALADLLDPLEAAVQNLRDSFFPGYIERSNQRRERNKLYGIAYETDHRLPKYVLMQEEIHRVQGNMEGGDIPEAIKTYQEAQKKWDELYERNTSELGKVEILRETTPWYAFSEQRKLNKRKRRAEEERTLMDYATTLWHEYTLRDRNKELRTRRAVVGTLAAAGALYFLHRNPKFFSNVVNNIREGYDAI